MQVVTKNHLADFTEKLLENDKKIRDDVNQIAREEINKAINDGTISNYDDTGIMEEISVIKQSNGISNEKYKNWLYGDNTEFNSHMNQEFAISESGTRTGKITSFPTRGTIFLKFKSSGFFGDLRLVDKNNKAVFLGINGEDRIYFDVDLIGFDTSYILFYLIKSPNSKSNTVNITNIALLENVVNPDNVMDALCDTEFSAEINVTNNDFSNRVRNLESKYYTKKGNQLYNRLTSVEGYKFNDGKGLITFADDTKFISDFIPCKPNTTYIISNMKDTGFASSVSMFGINKDKTNGKKINDVLKNNVPFTTDSDTYFLRFHSVLREKDVIMLNEGDTALPYEEYSTEIYTYLDNNVKIKAVEELEDKLAEIQLSKKPVVMIGDSIAGRIGTQLADINFDGRSYRNKAVGGETVLDTVGRMGAVPYMVLPTTIPASGSVSIEVISSDFLKTEFDSNATPTYSNGYTSNYSAKGLNATGTIDCSIAGIHGKLKFTRNSSQTDFTATFTRDEDGDELVMDRPYKIVSEYVDRNSIFLCFMGTNGGWDDRFHTGEPLAAMTKKDFDYLISLYKRIRDYIKPLSNDYLFLGFYMHAGVDHHIDSERIELWNYFEHEMSKEFGQNYFSVREYLRTYGYKDAGITLTQDDINEILAGKIPYTSTCDDNVHLSAKVAKCVCNKILERLKENGSIESYTKLVI